MLNESGGARAFGFAFQIFARQIRRRVFCLRRADFAVL